MLPQGRPVKVDRAPNSEKSLFLVRPGGLSMTKASVAFVRGVPENVHSFQRIAGQAG